MIPSSRSHARLLTAALLAALGCQDHGRVLAPDNASIRNPAASHAPGSDPGDGELDPGFGTGGLVTTDFAGGHDFLIDMILQPDGRIVTAGYAATPTFLRDFALARYDADGSLDATFGAGGKVTTDFGSGGDEIDALVLQPDGKIIAGGSAGFDFALARYNADGSLDAGFGTGGVVRLAAGGDYGLLYALARLPDGRVLAAGGVALPGNLDFWLARFNTDGTLDATFGVAGRVTTDLGSDDVIAAMAIQSDGKLVVAGPSGGDVAVARYHPDGTLDATFGSAGVVRTPLSAAGNHADLVLQPDGKLVVLGTGHPDPALPADFFLARYNSDGSPDAGFGTGGLVFTDFAGDNDGGRALVLMPDGRLAAAGNARSQGNLNFGVARYLSDGRLDPSFGVGGRAVVDFSGGPGGAEALVLDAAGRLVAGGVNNASAAQGIDFALARFADDTDGDGVPDYADSAPSDPCVPDDALGPCDPDGDGLTNDEEVALGTDPSSADSDSDGILDSSDPDIVGDFAAALPDGAFADAGHRGALLARLEAIERQIANGNEATALGELRNLRRRFDGCNGSPTEVADGDDWVVDCAAQREIRRRIDLLIASLGG